MIFLFGNRRLPPWLAIIYIILGVWDLGGAGNSSGFWGFFWDLFGFYMIGVGIYALVNYFSRKQR